MQRKTALSPLAGAVAGIGGLLALFGTYWDDAWHTDRGRDAFLIPPHLTLYAGVTVTGLVTAAWLLRACIDAGGVRHARALLRQPAVLLALVGATATLSSAPIDDAWHRLYGRDAVLWSPPHMLGVAGSSAMSVGLLAGLGDGSGLAHARRLRSTRVLLSAGVLGSLLVPVLEFDSDVPQFPAWTYWPAATAGVILFLLVVRDLAPARWTATAAAGVYTLVKIAILGVLAALDHSGTLIAPVLAVAVTDDVLHRRGARATVRGLVTAVLVPATWSVATALQPGQATQVPADQVPAAVALSFVAAVAVLAATGQLRLPRRATAQLGLTAVALLATAVTVLAPTRAWAHDPGQGAPAGQVRYDAERTGAAGEEIALIAQVEPPGGTCSDLRPQRAVARRAGKQVEAPLELDGCTATTRLRLPQGGRWFVYVNLSDVGGAEQVEPTQLESWVPVTGNARSVSETRDLYVLRTAGAGRITGRQLVSAVLLYVLVVGLLVGAARLAHRSTAGAESVPSRQPGAVAQS